MRLDYFSNVVGGKLQPNTTKRIVEDLKQHEGHRVHITIDRHKPKRTLPQNAFWHMHVGIIAKDLGYDPDEMKAIIKCKFLKRQKVDERTGELFDYIAETRTLNKMEFMELIDKTMRWASETFGIVLPDPEPYGMDV